jgi:hypothetical protein
MCCGQYVEAESSVQYAHFQMSSQHSSLFIVFIYFRYASVVNKVYKFVMAEHASVWSVLMILIRLTEYERKYRNSI